MFIKLREAKSLWQIPDTDILLTVNDPVMEFSQEEFDALTEEQRTIFVTALDVGFINLFAERPRQNLTEQEKILNLSANEIQRKYISKMVQARKTSELEALKAAEEARPEPRQMLIKLMENSIERILGDNLEERLYREIREEPDVIEESETPSESSKKSRRRTPRLTEV